MSDQFGQELFRGTHGISEVTWRTLYTEYDVWIKDHPIIHKVVLTNNWSPAHDSTDKVYLKEVQLHSGVTLIPDDKNYQKLVDAVSLLKEVSAEVEE